MTRNNFFLFKIRIPPDSMNSENFVRYQRRKFKKITNKATNRVNPTFWGHLQFTTKSQNFNRDDVQKIFYHCLLHLKTAFKTEQ